MAMNAPTPIDCWSFFEIPISYSIEIFGWMHVENNLLDQQNPYLINRTCLLYTFFAEKKFSLSENL